MGILDAVGWKSGDKSLKTKVREAETKVEKIRAVMAAPAKRLVDAEENLTQREAQVVAAEADAVTRALAGEEVPDYTVLQTALAHDKNKVKACATALAQVRAESEPALQAAIEELDRAQKALEDEQYRAAIAEWFQTREAGIAAGERVVACTRNRHPDFRPSIGTRDRLDYEKAFYNKWANRPIPQKAEDFPTRAITFDRPWGKWSDPDGAVMATDAQAFLAVVDGAAHYTFTTPETEELTQRAQKQREHKRTHQMAEAGA